MPKFNLNVKQRYAQYKNLMSVVSIAIVVMVSLITVFSSGGDTKKVSKNAQASAFDGVLDDTFADSDSESALTSQQLEISDLKSEVINLKKLITKKTKKPERSEDDIKQLQEKIEATINSQISKININPDGSGKSIVDGPQLALNTQHGSPVNFSPNTSLPVSHSLNKDNVINGVSYVTETYEKGDMFDRNPNNYVPSGSSVKAIVLGGADADASVNSQRGNNGVMLFKLLSDAVLPNGKRAPIKGCRVTAGTIGDISSERAYVVLDKISCAKDGMPIVDKSISGWAFFGGKVGIKGKAIMRDGKIIKWAGISGALSGIANAAQYAQSIQNISAYGATSVVPSSKIGSYAGLGGASKAADQLSSYYIKRAEQYHPLIQVGAGNLVNIVFKDGFSLFPNGSDEGRSWKSNNYKHVSNENTTHPSMPDDLINQIKADENNYQLGSAINPAR